MSWTVTFPERLDQFVQREASLLSRGKAQKAIEAGTVFVNGKAASKMGWKLKIGDEVIMQEQEDSLIDDAISPINLRLKILYEDDLCAVINKPAGYAAHPGAGMEPGQATILHGAAYLYKKWNASAPLSKTFSPQSVLVHRLDQETTGCMLIAKNPAAHLALQKQFEDRSVDKRYLALVAGVPSLPTAMIDAPIGRSHQNRTKMSVRASAASRQAKTTYHILASAQDVSLLECELHTGRTHQVRVHLHSIGHPILGDTSYVSSLSEKLTHSLDVSGICLHAWTLAFDSPFDGTRKEVKAPMPAAFKKVLKACGISVKL